MLENNNAKQDENNGVYIVSSKNWDSITDELWEMGVEYDSDENGNNLITVGKSEIIIHVNKSRSRGNNKPKTETTETESHGVKSKNNGYIVVYKSKTDKNEKTNKSLTTCSDIKSWLKTIEKKSMEYLRIYDTLKNPCRLSAWIER